MENNSTSFTGALPIQVPHYMQAHMHTYCTFIYVHIHALHASLVYIDVHMYTKTHMYIFHKKLKNESEQLVHVQLDSVCTQMLN